MIHLIRPIYKHEQTLKFSEMNRKTGLMWKAERKKTRKIQQKTRR